MTEVAEREEQSRAPRTRTPLEIFRSWAEKNPLIGKMRKPGATPLLVPEQQRAEFPAKNGKPGVFRITVFKLKKEGHCALRRSDEDIDHYVQVSFLTEIAKLGQSEWVSLRLAKGNMISVHRKGLTQALKELGYLN
jgi:hypothetical protein